MLRFAGRFLLGLVCGALLGAIVAIFVVPRQPTDFAAEMSPDQVELVEDRRRLWILGVTAVACATLSAVSGGINLGRRTEFVSKGVLAGAFLAMAMTLTVSAITGDDPQVRDHQHGRVHAFGFKFLLPFFMATGGVLGWMWYRRQTATSEEACRNAASTENSQLNDS